MVRLLQIVTIVIGSLVSMSVIFLAPLFQTGTNLDWETIARYVPEILLVVIFMGYSYLRDEAARKERTETAVTRAKERLDRDLSWQTFLKEERDARTAWGTAFATGLTTLSTAVTANNQLIVTHDTWQRAMQQGGERRQGQQNPNGD